MISRIISLAITLCLMTGIVSAQDTAEVRALHLELDKNLSKNPKKALQIALKILQWSQQNNSKYYEAVGFLDIGKVFWVLGDHTQSLKYHQESLKLFELLQDTGGIISSYNDISLIYLDQGDYQKALRNLLECQRMNSELKHKRLEAILTVNIGETYLKMGVLDSAAIYTQRAYSMCIANKDTVTRYAVLNNLGTIYLEENKIELALEHFRLALLLAKLKADDRYTTEILCSIGKLYQKSGALDSSSFYFQDANRLARKINYTSRIIESAEHLESGFMRSNMIDSAYRYSVIIRELKDSMASIEKVKQFQNLAFLEEVRQHELALAREKDEKERADLREYIIITLILIVLFSAYLILRKRKVKFRFIDLLATIGLLLLFEFIALIIHPIIGALTEHTPWMMLLALTIVASVLVPLHHFLTKMTRLHLTKKGRINRSKAS